MDQVFFRVPFASNGDTSNIPEAVTSDGSVNWPQGWPLDYEKDMDADANAKAVERDVMNFMFNAVTVALRQYQTAAFPEFITPADNNGTAFAYTAGTVIRYRTSSSAAFKNYVSLVNNNTTTPGADASKWQEFIFAEASDEETTAGISGTLIISPRRLKKVTDKLEDKIEESINTTVTPFILPVGAIVLWGGKVPPDGWIELNGQAFNTSENPELFKLFPAGKVPDWRGRFIRAWDNGAGIDPDVGRDNGSEQLSALEKHSHSAPVERASDGLVGPRAIRGVYWPGKYTRITTNAGTSEEGGVETRPRNIAAMYIIKTDQAEEQEGVEYPTAIVVSPATGTIQAGESRQFTGTILPASVAAGYVISWSVADASLGSINGSGLYSSTANKAGEQTIIATVQTEAGTVTGTATVTQQIWLTKIELVAPVEMTEGETFTAGIVFTPLNFTEPVQYSSSDSSVVTFIDGEIDARSGGTATVAVTGVNSGISASRTIKVTAAEVIEEYLRIENNLSEIAEAGEEAQSEARDHIGLGELAIKDSLNASDVGAAPMATKSLPESLDLDELTAPGDYFQSVSSYATEENHYPEDTAGALRVVATGVSDGACRQFYWPYNSTKEYRRCGYGDPLVFSEWEVF
ncbi:tail fiber protein [Enterobacter ludwigii]|uniref:tail fiber protein n=1 Tax=Enterobacter ludwigii TaxID=299767 RepID=UPI001E31E970|nr:tail fiber protein [Enterobacter ludwigii]MCE1916586.1 tail fiber protein [Enterobacter ludwigii]